MSWGGVFKDSGFASIYYISTFMLGFDYGFGLREEILISLVFIILRNKKVWEKNGLGEDEHGEVFIIVHEFFFHPHLQKMACMLLF